jgi:hypothetical protein
MRNNEKTGPDTSEMDAVAAEISALLNKHDLMGMFALANREVAAFRTSLEATWSDCSDLGTNGFRLTSRPGQDGKTLEERVEQTCRTIAAMDSLAIALVDNGLGVLEWLKMAQREIGAGDIQDPPGPGGDRAREIRLQIIMQKEKAAEILANIAETAADIAENTHDQIAGQAAGHIMDKVRELIGANTR